jgi:uracil-DNA glycosylase
VANGLGGLDAFGAIDPGWAAALEPVSAVLAELSDKLQAERDAGRGFLPETQHVLRAFAEPFDRVRVLLVGQDPYPTPGHPIGLSFAADRQVRPLPRSLANIYQELHSDLGIVPASHGDLSAWTKQGVLLLNRVLTVRPGQARAHRSWGWESVTECAIRALVARDQPLVAVLWGRDAATLQPMLGATPVVTSPHPSPLSARKGFFGSRPFSKVNALLEQQGAAPIDWRIDPN